MKAVGIWDTVAPSQSSMSHAKSRGLGRMRFVGGFGSDISIAILWIVRGKLPLPCNDDNGYGSHPKTTATTTRHGPLPRVVPMADAPANVLAAKAFRHQSP